MTLVNIYKIYNDANDEFYIGSSKSTILHRFSNHKYRSKIDVKSRSKLYKTMREIGVEKFHPELLMTIDEEYRNEAEDVMILLLNPQLNMKRAYSGIDKENYNKDYYAKYKDDKREYYLTNVEKIRQYYLDNKEAKISYQRQYYKSKTV